MKQYIIATLAAVLVLTACTEELEQPIHPSDAPGEARTLTITTQVMNETPALETSSTRATDASSVSEDEITDFFVIQYDHEGNIIEGSVQYVEYEAGQMSASLLVPPADASYTYTVVAIANTHNSDLQNELASCTTLEKLRAFKRKQEIAGDDDVFELIKDESANIESRSLLMSAEAEVGSTTSEVALKFYRNVAKLTLNIDCGSSGVTVNSVQLRNVPAHIFLAECLRETTTEYPLADETDYIDFPKEFGLDITTSRTMTYYLPRNCRGVSSSSSALDKPENAPDNATYVEIWATTSKDLPVCYRFYLGENMTDDYNVIHNHHYTLNVTIKGDGDGTTDARVNNYNVTNLGEANCYIINPGEGTEVIYRFPATLRSNRFWDMSDIGNPNNVLGDGNEWEAVVIWQDVQNEQVIEFCLPDGTFSNSSEKVYDSRYGTSGGIWVTDTKLGSTKGRKGTKEEGYIYFKLKQEIEGNVVIGLRKPGETTYLWSWHLWITNYTPDESKGFVHREGQYIYTLTDGGEVHHYADHSSASDSDKVWSEGKHQHGKFIMDRNLGATSASPSADDVSKTVGLFYQYGRKDPFPRGTVNNYIDVVVTYDIFGGKQTIHKAVKSSDVSADFKQAVQNPTTFYNNDNFSDWYGGTNQYRSTYWNDTSISDISAPYGKSLFDPSPVDWHLPENHTWDIFSATGANGGSFRADGQFKGGYKFYISNTNGGDTAWYPASGYYNGLGGYFFRAATISNSNNSNSAGYCWSATPKDPSLGYYFLYSSTQNYPQHEIGRASGLPVRCILQ